MTIVHYIPIEGNEEYTESYLAYDEFETQQEAEDFGGWIQNPENFPSGVNRLIPISQEPEFEPVEEGQCIALWFLGGPHIWRIYYIPGLSHPIIIP